MNHPKTEKRRRDKAKCSTCIDTYIDDEEEEDRVGDGA